MIYSIQLRVTGLTQTQANAGKTAITTRLQSKPRWDLERVDVTTPNSLMGTTDYGLVVEAHYTTRADLDTVASAVHTWLDTNAPVAAHGTLHVHDCTHDEHSPVGCVATLAWSK
jgi:hypothetical protein